MLGIGCRALAVVIVAPAILWAALPIVAGVVVSPRVALCRDNSIPIVVFSIRERGNLAKVLAGQGVQTIVQEEA